MLAEVWLGACADRREKLTFSGSRATDAWYLKMKVQGFPRSGRTLVCSCDHGNFVEETIYLCYSPFLWPEVQLVHWADLVSAVETCLVLIWSVPPYFHPRLWYKMGEGWTSSRPRFVPSLMNPSLYPHMSLIADFEISICVVFLASTFEGSKWPVIASPPPLSDWAYLEGFPASTNLNLSL